MNPLLFKATVSNLLFKTIEISTCCSYNYSMRKTKTGSSNYDFFLKMDTSKYKGEWIAISENKVIAHGKDAQKVYKIAKKKASSKDISLAKAPEEQMLVLTFSL